MQTITRDEIWRIGEIYRAASTGRANLEDIRWICESVVRAQWFDEMLYPYRLKPDSLTYGVIQ